MRTRNGLYWVCCLALALPLGGCGKDADRAASADQPLPGRSVADLQDDHIKTLTLLRDEPGLPPLPGREAVVFSCSTCHTTRYITMQPPLSRTVWTAEVHKMVTAFGAPVTEAQVPQLVEVLAAMQETAQPAARP